MYITSEVAIADVKRSERKPAYGVPDSPILGRYLVTEGQKTCLHMSFNSTMIDASPGGGRLMWLPKLVQGKQDARYRGAKIGFCIQSIFHKSAMRLII